MTSGALEVRPGVWACPGPALWIEQSASLYVADLHLGYSWALRRRGQLGPLVEGDARSRVKRLLDALKPSRLIVAGDLVHAPRPCAQERAEIENSVQEFSRHCQMILVRGNHDRGFLLDFAQLPVRVVESWQQDGWLAVHGDSHEFSWPERSSLILGHWHPAVSVKDAAGARIRFPAFLVWPQAIVLPAFSPFSAGFDLRRGVPKGLQQIVRSQLPPHCLIATPHEVVWQTRSSSELSTSSLNGMTNGGIATPRSRRQAKKSESRRC
jgi:hypothetical protein